MLHSAPPVVRAHDCSVLTDRVVESILRAARNSSSKVMHLDTAGQHAETQLPPGLRPSPVRGTRCFIDLEQSIPELTTQLCPSQLPADTVRRVNLYVSPPESGAPLHFDTLPIVVRQLQGSKLWQISFRPAVPSPVSNTIADEHAGSAYYNGLTLPLPSKMYFALLKPGDWLYVPAAAWHATFSTSGSVSATLAVTDCTSLRKALTTVSATNEPLPKGPRLLC